MRKKIFGFMDPSVIISIVVSLMLIAIGVFAVFVVTEQTEDAMRVNWNEGDTFQSDTLGANPEDGYYTYTEAGWSSLANVSSTLTDYYWQVNQTNSSVSNYSNFEFKTSELGNYNYLSFYFKQDPYNNKSYIYLDDSAGNHYGEFRILENYIAFWTGSELINISKDITDEHRVQMYFNLTESSTILSMKIVLTNATTQTNDTGYVTPASTVRPGALKITGSDTNNVSLLIDDIYASGSKYLYEPTDVGTTADSVFTILGVVIMLSAIMMIVGLLYSKYR